MIPRIAEMKHTSDYKMWLRFEDGKEGEIDLEGELWGDVFEPLKERDYFKTARFDKELNAICWPNGADFAPEFLYDNITVKGRRNNELART